MIRKNVRAIYGFLCGCLLLILCGSLVPENTVLGNTTTERKLDSIMARYDGGSVMIGENVDREKFKVTAIYNDGTMEEVTAFTISNPRITLDGSNTIIVVYMGKTANAFVNGKKAAAISASSSRYSVSVGNGIDKNDLTVQASYSDGSLETITDYTLTNYSINHTGSNKVIVSYKDLKTEVEIYGTATKTPSSLYASYEGDVLQGNEIDRLKMTVTAVFTDSSTERITTFVLSPDKLPDLGRRKVTVSFMGKTTTVDLNCIPKVVTKLEAVYRGAPLPIGKRINKSEIYVTAEYSDGSTGEVKDFTMDKETVYLTGINYLRVYYGEQKAELEVDGIEAPKVSFDRASSFTITRGSNAGKVEVALPAYAKPEDITGQSIKASKVKKLFKKLTDTGTYIPFIITFTEDALEGELPVSIRVTVPKGYKIEDCAIYYTPNRTSIIAKQNTEIVGDQVLQCDIYFTGTFLLTYIPST